MKICIIQCDSVRRRTGQGATMVMRRTMWRWQRAARLVSVADPWQLSKGSILLEEPSKARYSYE